jgi:thymidine phosphorylase
MIPQEFIRLKRDGKNLDPDALREFVRGVTDDTINDAQISAFCMAALLKGLTIPETAHLTRAMAESGAILKWHDLDGAVIDKHSTGGVGDKVSLMLAPIAAACGLYVPMIAGRGLGHTGGTIDKLDSIAGYKTNLPLETFQKIVCELGCAIIGQTSQLAPADRRIYAVRDVTATVESVPLITASILSKKLAAGLQGLVMDIKLGNGAFMQDMTKARELAVSLETVAQAANLPLTPVITDMNQVLGHSAGNAVEVIEAVEYLNGKHREARLHEVTITLAAHMLVAGNKAQNFAAGKRLAEEALSSERALEIFEKMIVAQGGSLKSIPMAPVIIDIKAPQSGYLSAMRTRDIGILLVKLKAGRAGVNDTIDHVVGLTEIAPVGTSCEAGKTILAKLHLRDKASAEFAASSYLQCLEFSDAKPEERPVIL